MDDEVPEIPDLNHAYALLCDVSVALGEARWHVSRRAWERHLARPIDQLDEARELVGELRQDVAEMVDDVGKLVEKTQGALNRLKALRQAIAKVRARFPADEYPVGAPALVRQMLDELETEAELILREQLQR